MKIFSYEYIYFGCLLVFLLSCRCLGIHKSSINEVLLSVVHQFLKLQLYENTQLFYLPSCTLNACLVCPKTALHFPRLSMCPYHVCDNYNAYIVAMVPCKFTLVDLTAALLF